MRITNNTMINNMMKHLQKNMGKLDKLNQQLSSGKQFQVPSEAPIKAANSMQYSSMIQNNEQYQRNLDQSRDWLESSETALGDAGDILQRARELAVNGANGSLSEEDRKDIAQEVSQLKEALINIGNSKLGDRYLFAGQSTNGDPAFADGGTYQGDYNDINREINNGIKMTINVNGDKAFSKSIETLQKLADNLNNSEADQISGNRLQELDNAINNTSTIRATIGAKVSRLEINQSRLEEDNINLQKLQSTNEDVDITEVITQLKMEESVYRASLASGARVMQPTLVDFLR